MFQKKTFFTPSQTDIHAHTLKAVTLSATTKLKLNSLFFSQTLPALHQQIQRVDTPRFRTFYTKYGNLNLLDEASQQVLYGRKPSLQSAESGRAFIKAPLTQPMSNDNRPLQPLLSKAAKPFATKTCKWQQVGEIDDDSVVVVLGLGLGLFLETLIQSSRAKAIVIYEKHVDMLRASMELIDWQTLFQQATDKGIALFIQAGNNAHSLNEDLVELAQAIPFQRVHYYRHYPDIDYDRALLARFGQALDINTWDFPLQACLDIAPDQEGTNGERFRHNQAQSLALLRDLKPHMADFFKQVKFVRWQPYVNQQGQLNLLDSATGWPLKSDNQDAELTNLSIAQLSRTPGTYRTDGAVTESIRKNYRYYQLLTSFDTERAKLSALPSKTMEGRSLPFPGLLLNGVGLGDELCAWLEQVELPNLSVALLLESDEEKLYASFAASPWLSKLSQRLDLGNAFTFLLDNPSFGYKDSMASVFYTLPGAGIAASLYLNFNNSAHGRKAMNSFIQAHQRLLYAATYDDNLYHINHAVANLRAGTRVLSKRVQDRETPIILVGNGPSLDQNMAWLKAHADQAIVVSCGTSIYTLYKAGLVPDFHSEIEIVKVVAEMKQSMPTDVLKQIDLLATISAHPDLIAQFGQAHLIARKGLEVTNLLKLQQALPEGLIETLDGAPTCVNLAACVFAEAGYQNLIFCGVDLAAREDGAHHASNSYYDDVNLKLLHGFAEKSKVAEHMLVEGFDGSQMTSKGEFIFALDALAQIFKRFPAIKAVNLSRGAHIPGTTWRDDNEFQLAVKQIDKGRFKTRFGKGFAPTQPQGELYSAAHLVELVDYLASQMQRLEAQVERLELGVFDYFKAFRQLLVHAEADPAQWLIALFARSSKFFEAQALAYATRYYETHEVTAQEAFEQAFLIAFKHWQQFYRNAIADLQAEPYHFENSSLKANKMLAADAG
ncbi:6-hydroxymethylpterin diphosphokinase MptE-like protein [Aliidiomarina maris]|uniref:Uncharacterized protein DUF115 n=1 Tax=Aliidiomarina maris TaxID=531312 RepID=A0A327X5W7_9GAMM|nr:6-hydroxymethylpterin diphosphokinase MptE-like protein [Aliidiomarina maris]MBA3988917.1 hypothetical protein [Idiomarina sp.]RAK00744.1 uncharacterized protein DUF115 [Aliidiomarina maris]RUO27256.1 hypothetical protein CWE07_04730 [Aliidiomarina maris]